MNGPLWSPVWQEDVSGEGEGGESDGHDDDRA